MSSPANLVADLLAKAWAFELVGGVWPCLVVPCHTLRRGERPVAVRGLAPWRRCGGSARVDLWLICLQQLARGGGMNFFDMGKPGREGRKEDVTGAVGDTRNAAVEALVAVVIQEAGLLLVQKLRASPDFFKKTTAHPQT